MFHVTINCDMPDISFVVGHPFRGGTLTLYVCVPTYDIWVHNSTLLSKCQLFAEKKMLHILVTWSHNHLHSSGSMGQQFQKCLASPLFRFLPRSLVRVKLDEFHQQLKFCKLLSMCFLLHQYFVWIVYWDDWDTGAGRKPKYRVERQVS